MKTRLFNHYEACTSDAHDVLKDSGLSESLTKLIQHCQARNFSLRDACGVAQQEVFKAFAKALLEDAMNQSVPHDIMVELTEKIVFRNLLDTVPSPS